MDELRLAFPRDCNLVQRIHAMLAEDPGVVAQGAGAGVNALETEAPELVVLVSGGRAQCIMVLLSSCDSAGRSADIICDSSNNRLQHWWQGLQRHNEEGGELSVAAVLACLFTRGSPGALHCQARPQH